MTGRRGAPWPPESAFDLTEGACLICDRPRYVDPVRGGCSCVGPSREDLAEIDARLASYEAEDQFRGCAGILTAVAIAVLATAAFFLFSWVVLS